MANQLTPMQRAQYFAQLTRQYQQPIPSQTKGAGETMSFEIPKTRLLAKVRLLVEATLKVTHASQTTYTPDPFSPFTAIRQLQFNVQNGFSTYKVNGQQLAMYSMIRDDAGIIKPQTSGRYKVVQGLTASASGASNTVSFLVDLPITINDRDPVGLILTQNQESVFTIDIDIADASALGNGAAGYTFEWVNGVKISPLVETFTVPADPNAFPDLSTLKLVHGASYSIPAAGEFVIKLPTGMIYRKLGLYFTDSNGVGFTDAEIGNSVDIVFNQADTPLKYNPVTLSKMNAEFFDTPLPNGYVALDWSYQGVSNYGGTRDYIDTQDLTEFWIRVNPTKAGKVSVVYENLTILKQ